MQLSSEKRNDVILGVDVGSTNIRCYAYDQFANVLGKADEKLNVVNPGDGRFEIVPDDLWVTFRKVVNNCLISSHLYSSSISCMGISVQRGTFLTWEKKTGKQYHNFISWKDRRADDICNKWNSSILLNILRFLCFLLYLLTSIVKLQIFSSVKFSSMMVLSRLYWILENCPKVRQQADLGNVLFGTIDTWLVWKLTGGKVHATDTSNACVTGFFDPFSMTWNDIFLNYFNIPKHILPVVKNTCDSYGETVPNLFGSSIPICCVVGDQQASAFGACCFQLNDVTCTMGTGSFLTINTGDEPSISCNGVLPLVGWTIRSRTTYVAEGGFSESGPFVTWMQSLGLLKNPSESSMLAQSVSDSGGAYFLPACNLPQVSEIDNLAASRFVGLGIAVSKEHMVRAVLESLAFQVSLLFDAVSQLCRKGDNISTMRMCGGIAKNDFVVQTISNITGRSVNRLKHNETSSLGAAFLAGLHCGVWKTMEQLSELQAQCDVFSPSNVENDSSLNTFNKWKKVLKKCS